MANQENDYSKFGSPEQNPTTEYPESTAGHPQELASADRRPLAVITAVLKRILKELGENVKYNLFSEEQRHN